MEKELNYLSEKIETLTNEITDLEGYIEDDANERIKDSYELSITDKSAELFILDSILDILTKKELDI